MFLRLGDLVRMRKVHPCGNDIWKVVYVGADIKIRCERCARIVMLDRPTFEKRVRKIVQEAPEAAEAEQ